MNLIKNNVSVIAISSSKIISGSEINFSNVIHKINHVKYVIVDEKNNNFNYYTGKIIRLKFLSLERNIVKIFIFCFYKFWQINFKLFKYIDKKNIIYVNDFNTLVYLLLIKLIYKNKLVFHCHSSFKVNFINKISLPPFINFLSNKIIVPSTYLKTNLINLGINENLIDVAYNGVPEYCNIEDKKIKTEKKIISLYGSVLPFKAQDIFVDAAKILHDKGMKNIKFIFAGSINDKRFYEELVKKNKLLFKCDYVEYVGELNHEHLIREMSKSSIVCCISRGPDVLPTVLIEALSLSKPVIGSKIGGIPEIIKDNVNGILINTNSSIELANAILEILENEEKYDFFSLNSLKIYKEKFQFNSCIKKMGKLLYN